MKNVASWHRSPKRGGFPHLWDRVRIEMIHEEKKAGRGSWHF
jgi:hypothetical protein